LSLSDAAVVAVAVVEVSAVGVAEEEELVFPKYHQAVDPILVAGPIPRAAAVDPSQVVVEADAVLDHPSQNRYLHHHHLHLLHFRQIRMGIAPVRLRLE